MLRVLPLGVGMLRQGLAHVVLATQAGKVTGGVNTQPLALPYILKSTLLSMCYGYYFAAMMSGKYPCFSDKSKALNARLYRLGGLESRSFRADRT